MNGKRTFWLRPGARFARALRGVLAVWFALLNLGVSMPSPPVEKASSQPFPCQDHRCGCRDADHCWRSCCCMTREQKFAWALEHGVTPPSSFFAEQSQPPAKTRSCCAKRHDKTASPADSETLARTSRTASRKAGGSRSGGPIALLDALRCHGESLSWTVMIPPSLRPDAMVRDLLADTTSAPLAGEPALLFSAPAFDPPVPPPRCG
jgi:hypothetical protein